MVREVRGNLEEDREQLRKGKSGLGDWKGWGLVNKLAAAFARIGCVVQSSQ